MKYYKGLLIYLQLITILFFISTTAGYAKDSLQQTPAGIIGDVSGTLISIDQNKTKHKLSKGDTFYFSTTLMTSKDSLAELNFNNGNSWTMKPDTNIKIISQPKKNIKYFKIKLGVGGLLI